MPIKIPDSLPAVEILHNENIFVMTENRAIRQDIRPLRIAILNLMPIKIVTETQLLRLLGNTALQVEIVLLHTKTHISKNTPAEHLAAFYKTFDDIKDEKFDGMIITGAPIEHLEYEDVEYWEELKDILDWTRTHVTSTMHICWAAQAALYYYFNIPKYTLDKKMFGVFPHTVNKKNVSLLRGFDDIFVAPHSRHTEIRREDIIKIPELEILSESSIAGVYIVSTKDGRNVFVTGHSEYDPLTLKEEYERDLAKGIPIEMPENYFPDDDPSKLPLVKWKAHSHLLFSNWLNYYVYQVTPYDLSNIR